MSEFSTSINDSILNWFRGTAFQSAPASVYVALFDGDPQGSGTELTTTITGAATRNQATFGTPTNKGAGRAISNGSAITVSSSSAGAASATHAAIYNASTGGTLLASSSLASTKSISAGDPVEFAAGALEITVA